ncbi:MAG: hypothetical protein ABJC62_13455 [Frankiaceae bacterium]
MGVCVLAGRGTVGWSLLVFSCGSMVAAAVALRVGGGGSYTRAALTQATLPTMSLIAALIARR